MRNAVIVAAARTAVGKAPKGTLRTMRPDDMAAEVVKAVLARAGIEGKEVEDVVLGCAFPEAEQGMNLARIVTLRAGLPYETARRRPSTASAPPACSRSPSPPSRSWRGWATRSSPAAWRACRWCR